MYLDVSCWRASHNDGEIFDADDGEVERCDLPLSTRRRGVVEVEHDRDRAVVSFNVKLTVHAALQSVTRINDNLTLGVNQRHLDIQRLGNVVVDNVRGWTLLHACIYSPQCGIYYNNNSR